MADNDRFKVDRTSSNRAGVTLMNNQVGHTVADVMRRHTHRTGAIVLDAGDEPVTNDDRRRANALL